MTLRLCIPFFLLISLRTTGQELYPTRDYSDLQSLNISLPYVKVYGDSALTVYGSNHTNNPDDPQIAEIASIIRTRQPDIILFEGDGIATETTWRETVSTYFEMGFAKYLADSLRLPSRNIEPDTKAKFDFLSSSFSIDDIYLATLGLQITMMQYNREDFDSKFPTLVNDLKKEGLILDQRHFSIDFFRELYQQKFGKPFTYDNFDSRDIQAKYNRTVFNRINQEANKFRDQHIIRLVDELAKQSKSVFLLVGGWHAIVCEPAFDKIFTK